MLPTLIGPRCSCHLPSDVRPMAVGASGYERRAIMAGTLGLQRMVSWAAHADVSLATQRICASLTLTASGTVLDAH